MNIMVYTSQTTSLAVNEVLANVDYPDLLDDEMLLYEATIPAGMKIEEVTKQDLPRNWQRWDPPPRALKELGRVWIESLKSPVLKVPSALVPWESNYLLNPSHPDFKKIRVLPPKRFSMLRYK
jgi:RES domain-containing protein